MFHGLTTYNTLVSIWTKSTSAKQAIPMMLLLDRRAITTDAATGLTGQY